MIGWKTISLKKYQELDKISRSDHDNLDKTLLSVCAVYDLTPDQLDGMGARRATRMARRVEKLFTTPVSDKAPKKIGGLALNYDPSTICYGQYAELMFFLTDPLANAHYVMASIVKDYSDKEHPKRSEYFLQQPVTKVMAALNVFSDAFAKFNGEYKALFGLDKEVHEPSAIINRFNKMYGWIYSAEAIAQYERVELSKVYQLPIRQALNDLVYIKAKSRYETEIIKQNGR